MARKPDILSDRDNWGDVLNEYLDVSLAEDGGLKSEAVSAVADTLYPDKAATEAAIARAIPSAPGAARQRLVINAAGDPDWATEQEFDLAHPYYGVTGSGVETARVQAAIDDAVAAGGGTIRFPAYSVRAPGLVVNGQNVTFQGRGRGISILYAASGDGDLVTLDGASRFGCRDMEVQAQSGSNGHVFNFASSLSHGLWFNLRVVQANTGKSIIETDGATTFNYIDNQWFHVDARHAVGATVPAFNMRGGAINRNRWTDVRPTYSGKWFWHIESTSAASYANDNTIEGITGEVLTGGAVKLLGAQGTRIVDFAVYDLSSPSTEHIFYLGDAPAGLATRNTTLQNVRRNGFSLGSGLYDVYLQGTLGRTTFLNCGGATLLTINANSKRCLVVDSSVNVTSDALTTYLNPDSTGFIIADPVTFGKQVKLASYTTAGRPSAATAGAGAMVYDTTLGQPIWSDGTNWTDATGVAV